MKKCALGTTSTTNNPTAIIFPGKLYPSSVQIDKLGELK